MIRQDSDFLNDNGGIYKQYGCYVMCHLWFINKFNNRTWTPQTIRRFVEQCQKSGWIDHNLLVMRPEDVFNFGGLPVRIRWDEEHKHKRPPEEECRGPEFEVLRFFNRRTGYGHFVAGDGFGNVTYDPLGESVTVAEGYLESKRIFRRT